MTQANLYKLMGLTECGSVPFHIAKDICDRDVAAAETACRAALEHLRLIWFREARR